MKYVANPVIVDAFEIIAIDGDHLKIDKNQWVTATPEMTARMTPQVGDYWVIQSDGYIYLNPKDVFERKYRSQEAS